MVITTVAFDADDTLIDTSSAVVAGLTAVVAATAEPSLTLEVFQADAADWWARIPERPVAHIRSMAIRHTLARVGRQDEASAMMELFTEVRFASTRPFPGVLDVLAKLRTDYRLGYATNGNSVTGRCGLGGEFGFELYALVTGVPKKPDPAFYAETARLADARPEQIMYVGDDYVCDVVGPSRFGMRTVWLNPAGLPVPGPVWPDAVIENLSELPRILTR